MAGTVIYEAHPAMFRAHPWWFIGCIILIPVFGLGVLLLLHWYIHTRQTALTVTDAELLYERGILSKDRTSVSLKHVRAVHVTQGFLNRILGVGTIQISTAGDQPEFTVADMPDPGMIRERSRGRRTRERIRPAMPSAHDDRDRKDSLRLLLAAAVALILLVAIVWGGLYYLFETANFTDPFAAGLGLKNAALIAFGVSLAVILVMAVVSGGDAIFGELPFTIAGFLIFFVIFWLMIAWIF
jgi:uncharacterized membrane protein YdbT with pleckstrin-like domain